jgi:PBP1b-binding outer membrane lipoprotein LpoB
MTRISKFTIFILPALLLAGCASTQVEMPTQTLALPEATEESVSPVETTATALPTMPTSPIRTPPETPIFVVITPDETSEVDMPANPFPNNLYLTGLLDQARQDLAQRLNVSVDQIEFIKFEAVVWPDGSMGCPQPGMAYTQVMHEGYRMILGVDGQDYAYHGGEKVPPFLCENTN